MALELPNTDNQDIARMALAWSIVLHSNYSTSQGNGGKSARETLTNAYIETYNAILENERNSGGVHVVAHP